MKKVLIVSYLFAPVNTMASKRFSSMCGYLDKQGYVPYILTVNPPRKLPKSFAYGAALDLKAPIDDSRIIRCGRWADQSVTSVVMSMILDLFEKKHIALRCLDKESYCWYEACKRAYSEEELKSIGHPELVIGTYPGMGNLYVAYYLAKKWKVPFVMDIRDLMSQFEELPKGFWQLKWLDKRLENFYFRHASGIVTVTKGFKKILTEYHHKRVAVVYNGWEETLPVKNICNEDLEKCKYLYYAGSLYGHRLESLRILVRALKKINANIVFKILLRITGPMELIMEAKHMFNNEGVEDIVCLMDGCDEETVREEQSKAYINIVLSDIEQKKRYLLATIPGKLIELLTSSQPILAVTAHESEIAYVLRITGKGAVAETEDEIIHFLEEASESMKYMGDNKAIEFFSREHQAVRLCRYMDMVLNKKINCNNRNHNKWFFTECLFNIKKDSTRI